MKRCSVHGLHFAHRRYVARHDLPGDDVVRENVVQSSSLLKELIEGRRCELGKRVVGRRQQRVRARADQCADAERGLDCHDQSVEEPCLTRSVDDVVQRKQLPRCRPASSCLALGRTYPDARCLNVRQAARLTASDERWERWLVPPMRKVQATRRRSHERGVASKKSEGDIRRDFGFGGIGCAPYRPG